MYIQYMYINMYIQRAKFDNREENHTVRKCNLPNCGLMYIHDLSRHIQFLKRKKHLKESMSCDVKNLIKLIQCTNC